MEYKKFILKHNNLNQILKKLKKEKKKIVFTNGCFDLLHIGHLRGLAKAKEYGDVLIVGLNSDNSVKKLKGDKRPIFNFFERAEFLLSLKPVDFVAYFDELTPLSLIKKIKPDVLVKGSDYKLDEIVGANFVIDNGGKVIRIELVNGYSTSKIIGRILQTYKCKGYSHET